MTDGAYKWGRDWYERHWNGEAEGSLDRELHGGYVARKQTHIHKTAMILSVSRREDMVITEFELEEANILISSIEGDFNKVFAALADNREVHHTSTVIKFVASCPNGISKRALWRRLIGQLSWDEYNRALLGATNAEFISETIVGADSILRFRKQPQPVDTAARKLVSPEAHPPEETSTSSSAAET